MECPVCGCLVDLGEVQADVELVTCDCCGTVWLSEHEEIQRILVGTED
jgi:Zn-finger nucleic acid-binding protein